jgi:hypothetical protein
MKPMAVIGMCLAAGLAVIVIILHWIQSWL